MRENKVAFKEVIELFAHSAIYDLAKEVETPKINIVFKEEAFDLFYDVMNNPHQLENAWTPNISERDIDLLRNQNDTNCPTIYVKDHIKFFKYLTNIINNNINLYDKYNDYRSARAFTIRFLRRIWLRMSPNDFNNVEEFLEKQLEFVKNDIFYNFKDELVIDDFYGYNVTAKSDVSFAWDEAPLEIKFKIYDEDNKSYHLLPHIYYGIENDTCYIYAIQNDIQQYKISKIERLLYKLNKGIENPNVHPSMVYSIKLFINLLKEYGINKIKVPTLQVLSYRYHELLSEKEKIDFSKRWNKETLENLKYFSKNDREYKLRQYELEKMWYDHVVDKEDVISRLKTENLINLVYRIVENDDSLTLTNDIDIDDSLTIKINNNKYIK